MTQRPFAACQRGAALLVLLALTPLPARADDQDRMQGAWKAIHAQVGDKTATTAQLKKIEVIIEGNKLTLVEPDRKYTVHFSLNSDATPREVDFYKAADKKEKIWLGLYEFDGKDLKLCWAPVQHNRPKKFGANDRNDDRYFILQKKK